MISTLTSLLSRAETVDTETETEATDDQAARGGDNSSPAPDLAAAEPAVSTVPDEESTEAETAAADRDDSPAPPETDWEFVSGMVDRTMTEKRAAAGSSSPDGHLADTSPEPTEQTAADGTAETVGAGPFAGVPLADLEEKSVPIVEAEAAAGTVGDATPTHAEAHTDSTEPTGHDPDGESVVEAFIAELETTDLSAEERSTLRDALGVETTDSVRVRLSHLQSDVADLRAYADEIERILDEESEADRLARDLGRRIDGLRDRLDDTVADLESELATETEAREADVERLETRIEGVATTLTDSVVALHHDVEALHEEVETNRSWREDVTAAFATRED